MLKEIIPPYFLRKITGMLYGWSGNYKTWEDAKKKCTGYDSKIIFNNAKQALLKVKNGEAAYERDTVIFDKIQYSFPLLSALSLVALEKKGKLNVLDFGGSFGSSYFQNKFFFEQIEEFNWCIVEQTHFVKEGQQSFANKHLSFFYDIESCIKYYSIDFVLFGSVLQYLKNPYSFLNDIFAKNIKYIMIDRTPVLKKSNDRITIQKVPKKIYEAKYPCWFLNEKKLLDFFSKDYELLFEDKVNETINISNAELKAYFFKRKQ